jgi:uncharacterized membrane protein YphA (DoxX/SURF4 family)
MLNPFPELLFLQHLAPTLLRVAAACVFFYLAYNHLYRREALGRIPFPIVGSGAWIVWFGIFVELVIGAALFVGYAVQVIALVGAVAALKHLLFGKRYHEYFLLSRGAALLLIAILLSLVITGAGLIAFDIPL